MNDLSEQERDAVKRYISHKFKNNNVIHASREMSEDSEIIYYIVYGNPDKPIEHWVTKGKVDKFKA